ncbi:acetyl-CoA carboxylase biotin carboxyl carrier protein [Methylobacterium nonmethylotrophicum]|uniref:Acetyl-CoA carboxylase biotin carboxyl carrier protein subunit n=1 Tax=Methylobacterium nonmethylotrophicum TaxID=1141884 RepID=A0A4Z0NSQ9_9HYPH|nr:acetyl-CoA carboxylase biotin carboxyl carrier protein subunit [Methylobacterium nonmethylotrophicum]TGD99679.1 acetyl-CoA carboxylase biotin carboxyl carrier protein subunit [Methylobacterium nonmethylotrophicum]
MTSPLAHIPDLAAWLAASGLAELELRGPAGHVRLVRGRADAVTAAAPAPPAGPARDVVRSPGVGHFLSAHPLRPEPLVGPGDRIAAGQPVGLLRVGDLLVIVTAPVAATVIRVVAQEAALVGYGDSLVEIQPEG